jgi:hypothetical protein
MLIVGKREKANMTCARVRYNQSTTGTSLRGCIIFSRTVDADHVISHVHMRMSEHGRVPSCGLWVVRGQFRKLS